MAEGYSRGSIRLWNREKEGRVSEGIEGRGGWVGWRSVHWHSTAMITQTPLWASIALPWACLMTLKWQWCEHWQFHCYHLAQSQPWLLPPASVLPIILTLVCLSFLTWGNAIFKIVSLPDVTITTDDNNDPLSPSPLNSECTTTYTTTIRY